MGESSELSKSLSNVLARKGAVGRGVGFCLDAAFILLCAWLLARLFWAVLSPAAFVDVPVNNRVANSGATQSAGFTANPVIFRSFNPFNRQLGGEVAPVEEDAPETTLNLSIRSLFVSDDAEQSFVRIHTPDNEVRRYREGEAVVSGVTIERIEGDRVILLRNGVRETLLLNERNALGAVESAPSAASAPQQTAPGTHNVTADEWSFETFYRDVTIRRVAQPDQSTVLQIQGTTNSEMLARVGLRVNDKLISVNGYDMSDESLSDLYDVFRDESRFNFNVERNGQMVPVTIVVARGDGN